MTEPTNAEIIALNAGEIHFSESPTKYPEAGHGTQYHAGAPGVLSFARDVLDKWGNPAPVGVEPAEFSQFLSDVMTAAGLVTHGKQCKDLGVRLGDMCSRLRADQVLAMGRVPLTRQQLREAFYNDTACTLGGDVDFAEKVCRVVEKAHGIKQGGQHGTDT